MTRALPGTDELARAVRETGEALAAAVDGGVVSGPPEARAIITGLPVSAMNGVWATEPAVDGAALEAAVEAVAAARIPFCVQARPATRRAAARVASSWGLQALPQKVPLMALTRTVTAPPSVPELAIRRLADADAGLHGVLAGRAFDMEAEVFDIVTVPALTLPDTRVYLGEIDGAPVTTCLTVRLGEAASVFNVATPPEYRRRGYGAAITAHAAAEAMAAGARAVWLQSSAAGHHIYERLGFRTLERWSCWVTL